MNKDDIVGLGIMVSGCLMLFDAIELQLQGYKEGKTVLTVSDLVRILGHLEHAEGTIHRTIEDYNRMIVLVSTHQNQGEEHETTGNS